MCHNDENVALERGLEGANFFGYSLAHYYVFGRHAPAKTDVWQEYQARRTEHGFSPEAVQAAGSNNGRLGAKIVQDDSAGLRGAIGTPDQVREYLQRHEEYGIDQVIFTSQAGKNQHEHIMESLELFGREVLPEFKERDEKRERDKEQRLARVIDEVMSQARRRPSAASERRLLVPGDPACDGRPVRQRRFPQDARRLRRPVGVGDRPARSATAGVMLAAGAVPAVRADRRLVRHRVVIVLGHHIVIEQLRRLPADSEVRVAAFDRRLRVDVAVAVAVEPGGQFCRRLGCDLR
jgi:hypothetical protein